MVPSLVAPPYRLEQRPRWLIARFDQPWNVLSWSLANGGFQRTKTVAWLYLDRNEIAAVSDPFDWMRAVMHAEGLSDAVGFMTSRRAHAWVEAEGEAEDRQAHAVGTAGLSNALRVGDRPGAPAGTINLLVCVNSPVTTEAALEGLSLIAEAKSLAVLECGIRSVVSQAPATGTGTDYLALAWPTRGVPLVFAGKHTAVGSAIGQAAFAAVTKGVQQWQAENRGPH